VRFAVRHRTVALIAPRVAPGAMLAPWTPQATGYLAALFAIASLEAVPLWGRWVPGHLGFAAVACAAAGFLGFTPWLPVAAWAGAFLSDLAFHAWHSLSPVRTLRRHGAWWRAGLDVDDLSDALRQAPFRAFLRAKFSTRDRARLAYAAGKAQMPPATFAALSAVACALWVGAWVGLGGLLGWLARSLPRAWGVALLSVAFVALLAGVTRPQPA
jgi:membrane protein DedA with SNARE-associated domain